MMPANKNDIEILTHSSICSQHPLKHLPPSPTTRDSLASDHDLSGSPELAPPPSHAVDTSTWSPATCGCNEDKDTWWAKHTETSVWRRRMKTQERCWRSDGIHAPAAWRRQKGPPEYAEMTHRKVEHEVAVDHLFGRVPGLDA